VRFSPLVDRISGKGAGAWSLHMEAARLRDLGHDIIFLTVGDPDQAPPAPVIDATIDALRRHRTGYSSIVGYPAVRTAIARESSGGPGPRAPRTTLLLHLVRRVGFFLRCNAWPAPATKSSSRSRSTAPTRR